MNGETLLVLACLITSLALWGKLILGHETHRALWRIGVAVGATGSLFAAIGFAAPFQMYPCATAIFSNCAMALLVLGSMYFQPVEAGQSAVQLAAIREGKHKFLIQMGAGAGFVLAFFLLFMFNAGQRERMEVDESLGSAFNRMSVELSSVKNQLGKFGAELAGIKKKVDSSAEYDTLRDKRFTKGQEKILNQKRGK